VIRRAPQFEIETLPSMEDLEDPGEQAFQILHAGFALAPVLAGLDKFTNAMVDWEKYLAPRVAERLPVSPRTYMRAVGVVEIAAGLLVAVKPRWGGYVVASWLWGIIANLLLIPGYFDIALRDFGLSLGALALGRLSQGRR
jgi:hypothetical protein